MRRAVIYGAFFFIFKCAGLHYLPASLILFDKLKKKSIEIICPACKGGQTEPALAFSTYCRTCGEHLKIIKGVARLNAGPQLSGISSIRVVSESAPVLIHHAESKDSENEGKNGNGTNLPETWVKTKKNPDRNKGRKKNKRSRERENGKTFEIGDLETAEKSRSNSRSEEPLPSVAEVFGLTGDSRKETSDVETAEEEDYEVREGSITLGGQAAAYEELTEGSMAAMISDLVEQEEKRSLAKAASRESVHEERDKPRTEKKAKAVAAKKEVDDKPLPAVLAASEKPVVTKREISKHQIRVRCFRCNHCQWESKHAESTQCGRCNTYISLADYHIRQATDRVIRTRGNVTVHRRGSLIGSELACRDLLAMGTISTKIDCSGEARFKYSASVNGNLYCETLIVEKGTIVEFSEGVFSESVKIYGTLRGDVTCAGLVEVTRTGILDGDVTARSMDLHDGGTLTGEMTLEPDLKVRLPEVKGYDPSIID